MSSNNSKPPKYNTLVLLTQFQNKFAKVYSQPFNLNIGRDLKIMKRVKVLFEENYEELGDILVFMDVCFEQNRSKPIGTPYLLKATNSKLGVQKTKKSSEEFISPEVAEWLRSEREKVE